MKTIYAIPFILLFLAFFRIPSYTAIIGEANAEQPPVQNNAKNPSGGNFLPNNPITSPDSIKNYVIQRAKAENVDLTKVTWIVQHESQWGRRLVGDGGISLGIWQFNVKANPNISRSVALSTTSSTQLALSWLKAGKENSWMTWRDRCVLYPDENPPDCD